MPTRPDWIVDVLASAELSRRECVGLLINRDPSESLDDDEWFATTDLAWQRASRILRGAIEAGEFATAEWTKAKTDPRDDRDVRVSRNEFVEWAVAHRAVFPDCSVTSADLPPRPGPAAPSEPPPGGGRVIMATAQDYRDLRALFEQLQPAIRSDQPIRAEYHSPGLGLPLDHWPAPHWDLGGGDDEARRQVAVFAAAVVRLYRSSPHGTLEQWLDLLRAAWFGARSDVVLTYQSDDLQVDVAVLWTIDDVIAASIKALTLLATGTFPVTITPDNREPADDDTRLAAVSDVSPDPAAAASGTPDSALPMPAASISSALTANVVEENPTAQPTAAARPTPDPAAAPVPPAAGVESPTEHPIAPPVAPEPAAVLAMPSGALDPPSIAAAETHVSASPMSAFATSSAPPAAVDATTVEARVAAIENCRTQWSLDAGFVVTFDDVVHATGYTRRTVERWRAKGAERSKKADREICRTLASPFALVKANVMKHRS